ncbi:hypothetical protein DEO72_LG6g3350 [Vigna unguiculata]|uniref:Uncharacterized protein n=1 Tax=Vigna unguiculata TaxID=3917 RepID=A0A4D6ME59_VIGUN|nr:hypothetical protein DEO72_LG6g3350 [Vigna unguiculata]
MGILAPIEEAVTPLTSWYTDPSFFHLELDRVFYRGWQVVGNNNTKICYLGDKFCPNPNALSIDH